MSRTFLLLISFCTGFLPVLNGQSEVLDFEPFLRNVLKYHPISRQALNLNALARAELLNRSGAFDPELYGTASAKRFDGTNYYRTLEAGIEYQSPFALRARVGYEEASGVFLNPMNKVPEAGQLRTELTLPLGNGLFMDEARAGRRIARIGVDRAQNGELSVQNELLASAGYAYWDWWYSEEQQRIYEMVVELARVRQEAVIFSFINGAVPALDTLEATIQLRNRQNQLDQAILEVRNAVLILSNYRWTEEGDADRRSFDAPPREELVPIDPGALINERALFTQWISGHPDIRQLSLSLDQVKVDERLKREYLKPKADVSVAILGEGWRLAGVPGGGEDIPVIVEDFHIWKVSLGFPLLLRSARGGLQSNRIKQEQIGFKLEQRLLELQNKAIQYDQQMDQLWKLYRQQSQIAEEYRRLWEAETERFQLGKGSLFLINARESQWIEAELKAIKFFTEIHKTYLQRQLALGILANDYLE
jgi:outer membrane protein TolC